MKRIHLFGAGVGAAALMLAGPALASPPDGHTYNQWSATAGIITLNSCTPPACVTLISENGMLQARVREDNDPDGAGFFQTINVEEGFSGTAATAAFRNESFVASTNQGTNFDMAALQFVDLDTQGIMQAELAHGSMRDAGNNQAGFDLYQTITPGDGINVRFHYEKQILGTAQFSTNTSQGDRMRLDYTVDNVAGIRGTPFTARQTSGFYTQGSGTLETPGGGAITYTDGQNISTTFLTGLLWHGGPMHMPANTDRILEVQRIANHTTGEGFNWTNTNNTIDDTGVGFVNFVAVWETAAGGLAAWDANFGDAPAFVPAGTATLTGITPAPAGNMDSVFPGFDHGLVP